MILNVATQVSAREGGEKILGFLWVFFIKK